LPHGVFKTYEDPHHGNPVKRLSQNNPLSDFLISYLVTEETTQTSKNIFHYLENTKLVSVLN